MSVLTSLGIMVIAVLILALLQLSPGVFLLFSHYAFGKYSKLKASDLTLFFILGAESMMALMLTVTYLILNTLFSFVEISHSIIACILGGIFIALSIAYFWFYYRKGKGTELFISRKCANNFQQKIKSANKRLDAFLLGLISLIPELVFTLPIFITIIFTIMKFDISSVARSGIIILIVLISLIPLGVIHILFGTGHNLANVQKFRVKNKLFFRIAVSVLFLIMSALIMMGVK